LYNPDRKINSISWWQDDVQQRQFPRLTKLAINILSITGISDGSERAFSKDRCIISWERA
jgi:hAT family C-terminal dimerisation region